VFNIWDISKIHTSSLEIYFILLTHRLATRVANSFYCISFNKVITCSVFTTYHIFSYSYHVLSNGLYFEHIVKSHAIYCG